MILDALEQTADSIDSRDPHNTYAAVLGGPIFEDSYVEKLKKALRGFVTPGQCLGFIAQTKNTLERVNSEPPSQQKIPDMESSKPSRKRRKLDPKSTICAPVKAINFAFVCNVVAIVWPSLPIHSLADEPRSEAVNEIQEVNANVIAPLLSAGPKRERDEEGGSASRSWSRDVTVSSALRLQYALSVCTPLSFQPARDTKAESKMLRLLESSDVLPELKIEIVSHPFLSAETHAHRFPPQGRSLLLSASLGTLKDVETLAKKLLSYIKPVDPSRNESWGGRAFQLSPGDRGSRQLGVALLHILSHRWLPTLRYRSLSQSA